MCYRSALLAVAAICTIIIGVARADTLKPIQAYTVDLGALAGVAYYTVEQDGYRLVVSLQAPETDTPLRFVATLSPEQAITVSAPRGASEPSVDVHFVRHGERIEVKTTGVGD